MTSMEYSPFRSLSSIGRELLPRAERLHNEGMTWAQIARNLRVSRTTLFTWRQLEEQNLDNGPRKVEAVSKVFRILISAEEGRDEIST